MLPEMKMKPLMPAKSAEKDPVTDEEYWNGIRQMYQYPPGFINLENGYFSPSPLSVLDFHWKRQQYINGKTSWFMRREQEKSIEDARKALSAFLGCDAEELAITRNTTEALNTLIMGFPWKKGDEVVIGNQDYGSMVEAFRQVEKRYGIKVREAQIPLHPLSDKEVIDAYISQCTKKTRLLHITHLINLTGQIIPVAAIAAEARKKVPGILVASDSAHAVAQIDFKIPDLNADFVGASLHKWLCNPLGVGFLWMRKQNIPNIWPLMGDTGIATNNIRRFEHQGTRPIHILETIAEAIRFHQAIGSELKEKRLRYLMQYWTEKVSELKGVKILTPMKGTDRSCAIANIAIDGYTPDELSKYFLEKHKIFTVAINHPVVKGVRVTPHLYNSISELDALVEAVKGAGKS